MTVRACGHCHRQLGGDSYYCNGTCRRLYQQRQSEHTRATEGRSVEDALIELKVAVRVDPSAQAHLDRMIPDRNRY
ncbi:hypothetical protein [Mycobacterium marseillense]|uniref:hypothetical protein n=1 Tax=Mycobacterium marseillense TaxID=701042 RepID=UPI000ACB0C86|nr:hypothetical protein [Mycobacterium marseillense]MCA2265194.1 hypothetical protein [Mycobacterium marseillense]